MSRYGHVDGRTPVVVAAQEVVHRPGDGFECSSATGLMLEAATAALAATGAAEALGAAVGEVLVPHGTWTEPDPGRAVAEAVGAPAARSVRSELGVLQLKLVARACDAVASGDVEVALVVGAENRWSGVVAAKEGRTVPDAPSSATAGEPDELLEPGEMVISPIEIERNLTTAAHQYAIVESAVRHERGRSVAAHQRWLGELWARFARVAAAAPAGWDQRALDPDEISQVSDSNRLIAAPYPKWLVSQWNVDQAVALVVTTVEVARRLGVGEENWVFPLAIASSDLVVPLTERAELHRWPAFAACADAAVRAAEVDPSAIDPIDLYSCFPVAVEVQVEELVSRFGSQGLRLQSSQGVRPVTLTGGMTFGGGPFNSYALHGAAAMVRVLQQGRGPVGLTSAVSGLLTKPAVAVWTTQPPTNRYSTRDLTEPARRATPTRPVDPELTGPATVVGATVVGERDGGLTTVALVESAEGVRSVAQSRDKGLGERFVAEDRVGATVQLSAPGELTS